MAKVSQLGTAQTLWWVAIYSAANWLYGLARTVRIHLDAELMIPFIPAFIFVYRSIDLMFPLAPFILRDRAEIRGLTLALAIVTELPGACFLLAPAEPAYPPQDYARGSLFSPGINASCSGTTWSLLARGP